MEVSLLKSADVLPTVSEIINRFSTGLQTLKQIKSETHSSGAAEWFLDNAYLVQLDLKQLDADLTLKLQRDLPRTDSGSIRVKDLALNYIREVQYGFKITQLVEFTLQAQKEEPITIREVWALPLFLRYELGLFLVEQLENLVQSLCDLLPNKGPDVNQVGKAISSLREIERTNWKEGFEHISLVHHSLLTDPSGVYAQCDFPTRNLYRTIIEKYARKTGQTELNVAERIIRLASKKESSRERHIGYFLIDQGKPELDADLGLEATFEGAVKKLLAPQSLRAFLYIFAICTITALFVFAFLNPALHPNSLWYLFLPFLIFPASEIAVSVVQSFIPFFCKPKILPKLNFEERLPPEWKTVIAVHSIFADKESIDKTLEGLEIRYLGNQDQHFVYVILSDFPDSDQEFSSHDQEVMDYARDKVSNLRRKYDHSRFLVLFRKRMWNPSQEKFMAWERKRGKIEEFNDLILGSKETSFLLAGHEDELLHNVKLVITLDNDSKLPPGTAKRLVGTMVHPLNRPEINFETKSIISGYGILQPRVTSTLSSFTRTIFSSLYAGDAGIDPYSRLVSDIYQDLFHEASYFGKGIYDVQAFQATLKGRVPDNILLSHDLFDSSFARCGLVSDIELFEDIPSRFHVYMRRLHRWVRGDWQLIPFLLRFGINLDNRSAKNSLSLFSFWRFIDNLRRSLVTPSLIALLIMGIFFTPEFCWWWILVSFFTLALPLYLNFSNALMLPPPAYPFSMHRHATLSTLIKKLKQSALEFSFLPYCAYLMADAIIKTIFRLIITKKHLLEWESAYYAEKRLQLNLASFLNEMKGGVLFTLMLFLSSCFISPETIPVAGVLAVIWCCSPALAYFVSIPRKEKIAEVLSDDRAYLEKTARETWNYFSHFLNDEHNYLIPDNYQSDTDKVANRTSPTNIGLSLLAVLSAFELKFIPLSEVLTLITKILRSITRLERHRGHLFNWYATTTLQPLSPHYVSFVDSGNLVAHLIVIRTFLEKLEVESEEKNESLALATKLIREVDFRFLFNHAKELFLIGTTPFDTKDTHTNVYDLLASEARLGSFVAICLGQVPAQHWFKLGRPLCLEEGETLLKSWSGTMFEYLMPQICIKTIKESLATETCVNAIRSQIRYARKNGVPWGISEAAFSERDNEGTFQYKAFGVPACGLKRGLERELVVSPYSSFLSLGFITDQEVIHNLRDLEKLGLRGKYGFYEAIDFSDRAAPPQLITAFFAHHQGMSLVSIANRLTDHSIINLFHTAREVRACELLLQEKLPNVFPLSDTDQYSSADNMKLLAARNRKNLATVTFESKEFPFTRAPVNILSNGRYSVWTDAHGAGASQYEGIQLTRVREEYNDAIWGNFFYIRDLDNGEIFSPTFYPIPNNGKHTQVTFTPSYSSYVSSFDKLTVTLTISVNSEIDAEIRTIKIQNTSRNRRRFEILSFAEVALQYLRADRSHLAFSKMFVRSGVDASRKLVWFARKPFHQRDNFPLFIHTLLNPELKIKACSTSRTALFGRGGSAKAPKSWPQENDHQNEYTLDPGFSVSTEIDIPGKEGRSVSFASLVAPNLEGAMKLITKLSSKSFDEPEIGSTAQMAQSSFEDSLAIVQSFAYQIPAEAPVRENLSKNSQGQEGLWRYRISGDIPIVLLDLTKIEKQREELDRVLKVFLYLANKGVVADLVLISEIQQDYYNNTRSTLENLLASFGVIDRSDVKDHVILIDSATLNEADRALLYSYARIAITSSGPLPLHRQRDSGWLENFNAKITVSELKQLGIADWKMEGNGCRIELSDLGNTTPLPWSNVIASKKVGTLITESGGGYSWFENSREYRINAWSNDPLSDPISEMIYLVDTEKGVFTPLLSRKFKTKHSVTHRPGKTIFDSEWYGMQIRTEIEITENGLKTFRVTVKNASAAELKLKLYYHIDWVLGVERETSYRFINTQFDAENRVLVAFNPATFDFRECKTFIGSNLEITGYSADRESFVGTHSSITEPQFLKAGKNQKLSNQTGVGMIPCGTLSCELSVAGNSEGTAVFFLGVTRDEAEIAELVRPFRENTSLKASEEVFQNLSGKLQIETPDNNFNLLVNSWLPYQSLHGRMLGRTGFYQSSGALGFRDQLQDSLGFLHLDPSIPRAQIILNASRQFIEGDVQHWWHPPRGKGVRTKFSDDLLWLPYAVVEYIKFTGDKTILTEEAPYLEGQILGAEEHEKYFDPTVSKKTGTVLEHAIAAIDRGFKLGAHELPLIGIGDWNDGMNRVGHLGKGESVWLGWFLGYVLKEFSVLLSDLGDNQRASDYGQRAAKLAQSVEREAWDGKWYKRAFFDDGTPLGTKDAEEAKIDSLAQSWAVLSGLGDPQRVPMALDSVYEKLVKKDSRTVALLTPPFEKNIKDPGYIGAYPPGVRENGAQYTHAATWVIAAFARLSRNDQAYELFDLINPLSINATHDGTKRYKGEPYVVCGDVYTASGMPGRAGWTWYTGAAGWLYRVACGEILGLRRYGNTLHIAPKVPKGWNEFKVRWEVDGKKVIIKASKTAGNKELSLNLAELPEVSEHAVSLL